MQSLARRCHLKARGLMKSPRETVWSLKRKGNRAQGTWTFGLGREISFWGCAHSSCSLGFFIYSPERELDPGEPQSALERCVLSTRELELILQQPGRATAHAELKHRLAPGPGPGTTLALGTSRGTVVQSREVLRKDGKSSLDSKAAAHEL